MTELSESASSGGLHAGVPSRRTVDSDALKTLEIELDRSREESDLPALLDVEAAARLLAPSLGGRSRRKAERLGGKAHDAIEQLRRSGAETPEERSRREAREAREAMWVERQAGELLCERSAEVLQLLLHDGREPAEALGELQPLTAADAGGSVRVEIDGAFEPWSQLLVAGFERSRDIYGEVTPVVSVDESREVQRLMKTLAVELMATGADVRGLAADVVPLIAYALFSGILSLALEASPAEMEDTVNDLMLATAPEVGEMTVEARPLFVALFRLAVLIGEAETYVDRLALTPLDSF
jgi:hypothetical protein